MDRQHARAAFAALGQFIVDNCDGIAAYYEEMLKATGTSGTPATDPQPEPDAAIPTLPQIPELAKGCIVSITVMTADSPSDRTWRARVDTDNRANRKGCGQYDITILDDRGRPTKHDRIAICHFDARGWQPVRNTGLADWAAYYRFDVTPDTTPDVDAPGKPGTL